MVFTLYIYTLRSLLNCMITVSPAASPVHSLSAAFRPSLLRFHELLGEVHGGRAALFFAVTACALGVAWLVGKRLVQEGADPPAAVGGQPEAFAVAPPRVIGLRHAVAHDLTQTDVLVVLVPASERAGGGVSAAPSRRGGACCCTHSGPSMFQ